MRCTSFLFFLLLCLGSLFFIIAYTAIYFESFIVFFWYFVLIMFCNFIYYLMMSIYSYKWDHNEGYQEYDMYFRDTVFQVLFLVNGGLAVILPLLLYHSNYPFILRPRHTTLSYFTLVFLFAQIIFFFIDLKIIRRSQGGYTSSQIARFAALLLLIIWLLNIIPILHYNGGADNIFYTFFIIFAIFFAGLGVHTFFLKLRFFYDFFAVKSSRTVVETSYYRSSAY